MKNGKQCPNIAPRAEIETKKLICSEKQNKLNTITIGIKALSISIIPTVMPNPHPKSKTLLDAPAFLLPCSFTLIPNFSFPRKYELCIHPNMYPITKQDVI